MQYIILNDTYTLRNEATCSYIVRKNLFVDSASNNHRSIYPIPPFVGYILLHIGRMEYRKSLEFIGDKLGIDPSILLHFLSQIIEQPNKTVSFVGDDIMFPENLLVHSQYIDKSSFFSTK